MKSKVEMFWRDFHVTFMLYSCDIHVRKRVPSWSIKKALSSQGLVSKVDENMAASFEV